MSKCKCCGQELPDLPKNTDGSVDILAVKTDNIAEPSTERKQWTLSDGPKRL